MAIDFGWTGAWRVVAVALALGAGACRAADAGAEAALSYEGSSTIGVNLMPEAAKAFARRSGVAFTSIGNAGSAKGFAAVMEGKVAFGGLARGLTEAEREQRPYWRIIGYDAIGVFVNAANPVTGLTAAQVKQIFTGQVTNWRDVGGHDAPIVVVTEIKSGGRATIEEFRAGALGGAEYGPGLEIDAPADCVRHVAKDPNAITDAALAFGVGGTRALAVDGIEPTAGNIRSGAYFLTRPLVLVSREVPRGPAKDFMDYLFTAEGQALVATSFAPLR